jgi:hypothetical protein
MPIRWSDSNTFQFAALHEALLFAYPTQTDFATFLMLKLGKMYGHSASTALPYPEGLLLVMMQARAQGWLDQLFARALGDRPNSPKLSVLDRAATTVADDVSERVGIPLEDLVRNHPGFTDLHAFLARLDDMARWVCRIEQPLNRPVGTGWLVAQDLVLTNWHVVRRVLSGETSSTDIGLRFDYGVRQGGVGSGDVAGLAQDWCVASSPAAPAELGTGLGEASGATLDYALLRLANPRGEANGHFEIRAGQAQPGDDDILFAIQHPDGEPVKLAAGAARGLGAGGWRLWHDIDTAKGSSGSPVLDFATQRVVALHHAGDVLYHQTGLGSPERNQAVPIARIVADLQDGNVPPFWHD